MAAIIKGVDEYQDLLRISVASAGNDHRLGANEAPPAIVSMFVGEELEGILSAIEEGHSYTGREEKTLQTGVHVLPDLSMDTTDRNRTSPFAFTGNKFEFRMLGSAISIACPNIMLNTIAAEEFRQFADMLEGSDDLDRDVRKIVQRVMKEHGRIIFNGDGYSAAWQEEAARRGLLNLSTTVDALPHYLDEKNVKLFAAHSIYTREEMEARCEAALEEYAKTLSIEAHTMSQMAHREILPAAGRYASRLAEGLASRRVACEGLTWTGEARLLEKLSALLNAAYDRLDQLDGALSRQEGDALAQAAFCRDALLPAMESLRSAVDQLETLTEASAWPYPSYGDLMFRV